MSNAQSLTEDLVKNFCSHRGFFHTIKSLSSDITKAKDGKLQIESFLEEMLDSIDKMDVDRLISLWNAWQSKIFNSLDSESLKVAQQYEANAYRLLLVKSVQHNDLSKCNEFFTKMSSLTLNNPQWSDWFSFPYNPHAKEMEPFKRYFDKQWQEIFIISLHNFLSICVPTCVSNSQLVEIIETFTRDNEELPIVSDSFDDELMDDFAVIAQCSSTAKASHSKTSIKSILKSFGKKHNDKLLVEH